MASILETGARLGFAAAWLCVSVAGVVAQTLPLPFDEKFENSASAWTRQVSPGAELEVAGGELRFTAGAHQRAYIQRAAGHDLMTVEGRLAGWSSVYLVWGARTWCGVGMVSPTPFGRIYTAAVTDSTADEVNHRGIDIHTPRWLRIQVGANYVRFEYSADARSWQELRTIARPKTFAGAPQWIAVGRSYAAADLPFSTASRPAADDAERRLGRVLEIRAEPTPPSELSLSPADLAQLRVPRVEPVTAAFLASSQDPTLDDLVHFYPPMKFPREVVGIPGHPSDVGVDWLGRLDVSPWKPPVAWLEVGDPPVALGRVGQAFQRRLLQGYVPVDTLSTARDGVEYELTVFGWSEGFSVEKPLFALFRLTARSAGVLPRQVALVSPDGKRRTWQLESGTTHSARICLKMKFPDPDSTVQVEPDEFEHRLAQTAAVWRERLAPAARFEVPDRRVMEAYQAWLAYSMLNADTINGYIEPHDGSGFYEEMFGNSVSVHSMALDQYGLHDYAARILDTQIHYQQPDGLYTQACGLTDPGGFLAGLAEHYRMTGGRQWLARVAPAMIKQCDWIERRRRTAAREGMLRGLIRFRPYNDYPDPAYNYLGNVWCAAGMRATAAALRDLDRPEAERIAGEAEDYRRDILASMDAAAFTDRGQTLLPMEPDTHRLLNLEKNNAGGYYGLTASPLLGIGLFAPDDQRVNWMVNALEQRGGLVAGVAEFDTGIDHAYTYGYLLNCLKRGEVRKALLGFWSMMAFGMTRDTYSPVEVTMIQTGENEFTLPHLYSCTEQLRLLRALLLREDGDSLVVGQAIPRAWLERGRHVCIAEAPTEFGPVSCRIDAEPNGNMRVALAPPTRKTPKEIRLHLRGAARRQIASVRAVPEVPLTYRDETIVLPDLRQPVDLLVQYRRN